MGQLSAPRPPWRPAGNPWPRSRRRRWTRLNGMASATQFFAAVQSLPRAELSQLTERMIDRLDEIDGDTDVELNGDEFDGLLGEDDFHDHSANWIGYPGCPVPDPSEDHHDQEQEEAHE